MMRSRPDPAGLVLQCRQIGLDAIYVVLDDVPHRRPKSLTVQLVQREGKALQNDAWHFARGDLEVCEALDTRIIGRVWDPNAEQLEQRRNEDGVLLTPPILTQ